MMNERYPLNYMRTAVLDSQEDGKTEKTRRII